MSRINPIVPLLVAAALATGGAEMQDARRPSRSPELREERAFALRLQQAVRAFDRAAIADLFSYPARISVYRRPFPVFVKDRAALVEVFDLVFTPQLRCAIAESREPMIEAVPPRYSLLLARGVVSMAGGRIIAVRSDRRFLITRMTSFGDTSARTGTPRQVRFVGTRRHIELAGRAAESGVDRFLVSARAGDLLRVTIGSFPSAALSLQVTRSDNGEVLRGGQENERSWKALLKEPCDCVVEVVRHARYCDPPVIPYIMTLSSERP
jgi:hypothetical protein